MAALARLSLLDGWSNQDLKSIGIIVMGLRETRQLNDGYHEIWSKNSPGRWSSRHWRSRSVSIRRATGVVSERAMVMLLDRDFEEAATADRAAGVNEAFLKHQGSSCSELFADAVTEFPRPSKPREFAISSAVERFPSEPGVIPASCLSFS